MVSSWFACWSFYWYAPLIGTLGGTVGKISFPIKYHRYINDYLLLFKSFTSGLAGDVFCSAWIKSCEQIIVSSVEEISGMFNFLGGNSIVSDIRSSILLRAYSLWHM